MEKIIHPGAALLVFLVCPPLILGFYGSSLSESAVTGILVPAGFGFSLGHGHPPDHWVSGALIWAGFALPVAVFMFILGAALRRDGTVTSNRKRFALAVLLSLLVAGLVAAGIWTGTLTVGGDQ